MARVDRSCVNLSGRSWNVYDSNNNVIGAIEPREFFTYVGYEGSLISIYFLSPSGAKTGYLHSSDNIPSSCFTNIINRPYGTITLDQTQYKTFMMRKQMNLYDAAGNIVGSVAAGKRVASLYGTAGQSMPYLTEIHYAEKRSGGWDSMKGSGVNYGFVDTGLRSGSSPTTIALYGNW